jgi:hypothetical protein
VNSAIVGQVDLCKKNFRKIVWAQRPESGKLFSNISTELEGCISGSASTTWICGTKRSAKRRGEKLEYIDPEYNSGMWNQHIDGNRMYDFMRQIGRRGRGSMLEMPVIKTRKKLIYLITSSCPKPNTTIVSEMDSATLSKYRTNMFSALKRKHQSELALFHEWDSYERYKTNHVLVTEALLKRNPVGKKEDQLWTLC